MSKSECVANLTALTDRYPMDVEQDGMAPRVMQLNAANLYNYVTGRESTVVEREIRGPSQRSEVRSSQE